MDPLVYEGMTKEDRMYLGYLAKQPGFPVLKKLMEAACKQAMTKIIKLKPEDPRRKELLEIYHLEAHVVNDVCSTLLKSIAKHVEAGENEEQAEQLQEQLRAAGIEVAPVSERQFGSAVIKSHLGQQ